MKLLPRHEATQAPWISKCSNKFNSLSASQGLKFRGIKGLRVSGSRGLLHAGKWNIQRSYEIMRG